MQFPSKLSQSGATKPQSHNTAKRRQEQVRLGVEATQSHKAATPQSHNPAKRREEQVRLGVGATQSHKAAKPQSHNPAKCKEERVRLGVKLIRADGRTDGRDFFLKTKLGELSFDRGRISNRRRTSN